VGKRRAGLEFVTFLENASCFSELKKPPRPNLAAPPWIVVPGSVSCNGAPAKVFPFAIGGLPLKEPSPAGPGRIIVCVCSGLAGTVDGLMAPHWHPGIRD
jgi:hypothetical protein